METFKQLNNELEVSKIQEKIEKRLREEYDFNNSISILKDMKKFYDAELNHYTKKASNASNLYKTLTSISVLSGGGGITAAVSSISGISAPISIPITISCGAVSISSSIFNHFLQIKCTRYNNILKEVKTKSKDFDLLLQEAKQDKVIDQREYNKLTKTYELYKENKTKIKKGEIVEINKVTANNNEIIQLEINKAVQAALAKFQRESSKN